MKKKAAFISLALIIVLSLCLSAALPVTANNPGNKPVAWVNFGGCTANDRDIYGFSNHAISVKLLSNGTTTGHISAHMFETGKQLVGIGFDDSQTSFYESNGVQIAEFVAWVIQVPDGQPFKVKYLLMDYGEPANGNDKCNIWLWFPGWPENFWVSMYGTEEPIDAPGGGNIQVHIRN